MGLALTNTRLSHALLLKLGGRSLAAVHDWRVNRDREVDDIWEVQVASDGEPIDNVPQISRTREITLGRYDLYFAPFERVFGRGITYRVGYDVHDQIYELTDQANPFELEEVWYDPTSLLNQLAVGSGLSGALAGAAQGAIAGTPGRQPPGPLTGFAGNVVRNARSNLASGVSALISNALLNRKSTIYTGCWLTRAGRAARADDDRLVIVDATVRFLRSKPG